jgi:hypothetical protein
LTSLTIVPVPGPPQCLMFLPIASKTGSALSNAAVSPPTMIVNVPAWAPPGPPLTGASRNAAPFDAAASAQRAFVAGLTVLWSIQS